MMLNGALANVTQPFKLFDESDTSPHNKGFIEPLNIQFGLLNHFCQNFGGLICTKSTLFCGSRFAVQKHIDTHCPTLST